MITSKIRIPKQERSIRKKEAIRETALQLFCNNGYYQTTTNIIAKESHMSVGSLYEYYKDKEDILIDILNLYFDEFLNHQDSITKSFDEIASVTNKMIWIRELIDNLVQSHKASKEFNKELHSLYFNIPAVRKICDEQKKKLRTIIYNSLLQISDQLKVADIETATIVFMDILNATIDRIVFYPLEIDSERIIEENTKVIYYYLFNEL